VTVDYLSFRSSVGHGRPSFEQGVVDPVLSAGALAGALTVPEADPAGAPNVRTARIAKSATCHTFRHSFATHVLFQ
jgi:site-specific recombinase XerD